MFPHFHHLILAHPAPPSLPPAIVFEEKWLTDNSRAQKQELKVGDCMISFPTLLYFTAFDWHAIYFCRGIWGVQE